MDQNFYNGLVAISLTYSREDFVLEIRINISFLRVTDIPYYNNLFPTEDWKKDLEYCKSRYRDQCSTSSRVVRASGVEVATVLVRFQHPPT
jgi:hypothetical protein